MDSLAEDRLVRIKWSCGCSGQIVGSRNAQENTIGSWKLEPEKLGRFMGKVVYFTGEIRYTKIGGNSSGLYRVIALLSRRRSFALDS